MSTNNKPIPVIINPASGKPQPVLHTVNETFRAHNLSWRGHLTYKFGDATRFAQQAVADGAEMVVYGGDGTVLEVANGVMGSDVAIGILPGGTGNAVATELGISRKIEEAAELICTSKNQRAVDIAQVDDQYYLLRAYTGVSQDQAASRELKDKYHLMAYPMEVVKVLKNSPHAQYTVTVDGKKTEVAAMTCFVNNLDNTGGVDIDVGDITPDDGLVDVMIVSKDRQSVSELSHYILGHGKSKSHAYHGQGKVVTVDADPPQTVWLDGEFYKNTPVTIQVHPGAVKVIVP
jgi:YegS/Rv2252/BmrU family lipid kinase